MERFRNEAQSVAGLNHPNILAVHDFGEDKEFTYIVMEYLTGGTLKDRLDRRLSVDEALEILTPLASALDYAHGRGVIHRDIKPSNVLHDEEGRPVLADFGLARLMGGASGMTGTGSVLGTAEYMALGRTLDHKADLYAFGVIVYQMLVGQTPFPGKSPTETLMAHIHETAPQPRKLDPGFPPRVEASVLKGIAKNPGDRYNTAAELVESLRSRSRSEVTEAGQGEQITVEQPTLALDEAGERRLAEATPPSESSATATFISPQQARLLAIQHAQENTSFYGPRYADTTLAWEVISQEDADDIHEIRLAYRPAGRFRGKAGVEQITISSGGQIELRQILDEPSPKTGLPIWAAGVAVVLVVAAGIGVFFATSDSGDEDGLATPVAPPDGTSAVETQVPAEAYTDLDTLIEQTFARTASLRGILPTEELNRVVVTREEMTQKQLDHLEKTRIQFGADEELYEVLEIWPESGGSRVSVYTWSQQA